MRRQRTYSYLVASVLGAALLGACAMGAGGGKSPSFFVTSSNPGKGGDLGGLTGADAYCQALGASAGAGSRTWRAYLSTGPVGGTAPVNARDRIGKGPWYNVKGELVANNVDDLHGTNQLTKQTALTEKGQQVSGRGDPVNMHDILTGSSPDGRAVVDGKDNTCGNWTSSSTGAAIVGHHDRVGLNDSPPAKSWNSSHPTQGCALDVLAKTGGNGRFYCFASN